MAVTRTPASKTTGAAPLPSRTAPKATGRTVPSQQETEEAPAGGGGSFANLFDQTPASSGFGIDVPPGNYEGIIVYARLEEPGEKGTSVLFKYEVADEGDSQGKVIPAYYRVLEADGRTVGKGMGILRKDLGLLGFKDVSGADVEDALRQLQEGMDGVSLKVKQNGQYLNVYLQGLVENSEIIQSWKATRPDNPY